MPSFSQRSAERLATCDPRLRLVFAEVVEHFDCSILEGHRSNERQAQMKAEGRSQLGPGESKHNHMPSLAVDVAPYPIDWNDRDRWMRFSGFVLGVARAHGIALRWGGDWDRDWDVADNRFNDWPHFEIVA